MATVNIKRASDNEPKPDQVASKDWYVDADGNVTNDVSLATQHIAAKGQPILPHIAKKYGFKDGAVAPKAIKQMAEDAEIAEKEAAKAHKAAERVASKGIGDEPDQVAAKAQAPAENKAAKK